MAAITTDTNWTQTLTAGSWDIWTTDGGTAYIRRASDTSHTIDEAAKISTMAQRFDIATGDTGYLYGASVKVFAYQVA